jgi:small-conductance mechanosensitive channel
MRQPIDQGQEDRRLRIRIARALIEVAFIVFLFYSNLLMGEFTATNGQGKTLAFAIRDIFTLTNFSIAVVAALIGHAVVHNFRKWL